MDLRAGNPEHIDFGHAVLAKFVLERCYKKQFFQLRFVPDIYYTLILLQEEQLVDVKVSQRFGGFMWIHQIPTAQKTMDANHLSELNHEAFFS